MTLVEEGTPKVMEIRCLSTYLCGEVSAQRAFAAAAAVPSTDAIRGGDHDENCYEGFPDLCNGRNDVRVGRGVRAAVL